MPPTILSALCKDPWKSRVPWLFAATVYLIVLYRTAWLGDDAFITLRSIDNFVHGYGLRWNVNERVQVYTHPLWLLVLLPFYALTREPFYTTIGVSIAISSATILTIWRLPTRRDWLAPLLVIGLAMSRAFVDYSTSGLENPLTHLLSALFFLLVIVDRSTVTGITRLRRAAILAGLCTLNRHDSVLLFAPAIVYLATCRGLSKMAVAKSLGIGSVAPLAWTLFSFVYYGFPFPNTAYAKLNVSIARGALVYRGAQYLVDFATRDPLSAMLILAAVCVVLRWGTALERWLLAGVLAYIAYVVSIGGDFMAGRFFSAPVLLCVLCLITRAPTLRAVPQLAVLFAQVALMLTPRFPLWFTVPANSQPNNVWLGTGIIDERLHYFPYASLTFDSKSHPIRPWHQRALQGEKLRTAGPLILERGAVGYEAYFAGPFVHFIDNWALCDPLLARIPYRPKRGKWRMGHFERKRPLGYLLAVRGDASLIQNETLSRVYRDILTVTRGPLVSGERLRAIYRLNTGKYSTELKKLRY